eukprot:SAG31_NODE_13611_length_857_cov_1.360158_1_plen_126_part_10
MYGNISATMKQTNHMELVLGTKGRSGDFKSLNPITTMCHPHYFEHVGEQFDIWQAVYSPMGSDGYPTPIWNKLTGDIDPDVAMHWKEHYDLRHILERDWATLWPKVKGKLHVYCGTMDNFYLNNGV